MILIDTKAETKSASNVNLTITDEKPTLSFGELLKGVSIKGEVKEDAKIVQNGALTLSLDKDAKDEKTTSKNSKKLDGLMSLLQNKELELQEQSLELNPKITQNLTPKEIKHLINNAKNYLRQQIIHNDGYIKSQMKDFPKTLKGLVVLAKKFNIDIAKITLEQVQEKGNTKLADVDIYTKTPKKIQMKLNQVEESIDNKQEIKSEKNNLKSQNINADSLDIKENKYNKNNTKTEIKLDTKTDIKSEIKAEIKPDVKSEVKAEIKPDVKIEVKAEIKPDVKPDVKSEVKAEIKPDVKSEVKAEIKPDVKSEVKAEIKPDVKIDNKIALNQNEALKQTPIFKPLVTTEVSTTEQVVLAKQFKPTEIKTQKEKADDTLKLLLRGEKPAQSSVNLTADFSVNTAKVIAPKATNETVRSLENLLRGDSNLQNTEGMSKLDQVSTHKPDSFEVKLNEAKQMVKYLSNDVKTAIEDYKSPFTRIKVQLNPQKLGEIDLTVIQRGKNLHVNLTSNNAAINALSMNLNDLKIQLSNNGINNATFNFSSGFEGGDSSAQQQQNQQNHQNRAGKEYGYFDNEEQNEEILNSLEIIVPSYA